jgi:hypothetical protein
MDQIGGANETRSQQDFSFGIADGRVDPIGKSFFNQAKAMPSKSNTLRHSWLKEISTAEFEAAPRIVRTQVTTSEANLALDLIQDYCWSDSSGQYYSLEFSEKEGHSMLERLTGTERRSKSILISLCHWQRLSMKRDADQEIRFAVNGPHRDIAPKSAYL